MVTAAEPLLRGEDGGEESCDFADHSKSSECWWIINLMVWRRCMTAMLAMLMVTILTGPPTRITDDDYYDGNRGYYGDD